jgi:hypothetical protein
LESSKPDRNSHQFLSPLSNVLSPLESEKLEITTEYRFSVWRNLPLDGEKESNNYASPYQR